MNKEVFISYLYILGVKNKAPAYSVGTSNRTQMDTSSTPAPNQYMIELGMERGVTIPKATKIIKYENDKVPGPGHYSYKPESESKGITIGEKFKEIDNQNIPGPGQYTVKNTKKGPSYTVGKKYNRKEDKSKVNDRFYDVEKSHKTTQEQKQNTIIGKAKNKSKKDKDVPGPGHYNQKKLSKGPAITIAERHPLPQDKSRENDKFYDVDKCKELTNGKAPSAVIGTSKRSESKTDTNLGPGYYMTHENDKGPAYTIASKYDNLNKPKSQTDKFYEVQRGYEATVANQHNTFMEKSVRKDEMPSNTPGVGSYTLITNKIGGVTMGAKLKHSDENSRAPGPGAYKPSWDEAGMNYTHDIKFGKAEKIPDDKHSDYPGPGYYKPILPWDKGPTMGTEERLGDDKNADYPGPGYYKPVLPWDLGPTIGTSQRTKFDSSETPGPPDYNLPTMVPIIYSVNKRKVKY